METTADEEVEVESTGATDDDWRASIADPDLQRLAGRYESVSAMAKAVADLRRETSVRIKPLGANASPEEIETFRRQTGVPETADGYKFDTPESYETTEADMAFRQEMAQAMHGANVSAGQAAALNASLNTFLDRQRSEISRAEAAALEANVAALQQEFGADYDRNIEFARRAARSFGNDGFVEFLETNVVDGVPLGDHPEFIRAFARIGRENSEPAIDIGGISGDRGTLEDRIRHKRTEIQQALDRGDHKVARRLDQEERELWQQMES